MKECTLEDIHKYILEILKYIDDVCKENNITYFLSGGTMLGAVREKGFIPWDDDADILVPRKDYMRLIKLLSKKEHAKFKLGSIYNDKTWSLPFARICNTDTVKEETYLDESGSGIFVDIFPIDGLPDSMFLTKLHYRYVRTLWTLRFLAIKKQFKPDEKFIPLKKIIRIWARKVGAYKISRRIDAISRRRSGETSNYVGATILPTYMSRERFPREVFEKSVYTKFEDTELSIPEGYDIYLTSLYGNYMVRPDVSERATHHHMKVYINE